MIAIVDDDKATREATEKFVRSIGYRASTFASAAAFLNPSTFTTHHVSSPICICPD